MNNQLNIFQDRSSFLGNFPITDWHTHGAPVLLISVSGPFVLEFRNGDRAFCHSAVINSGLAHKVDPCGEQIALFYLDSKSHDAHRVRNYYLSNKNFEINIAKKNIRKRHLDRIVRDFHVESLLTTTLPNCNRSRDHLIDHRIEKSLPYIHKDAYLASQEEVATKAGLSISHYSHLFSESMGISFRQYRQWSQLSQFYRHYEQVGNFTDAALLCGFFDSSHFSNTFKKVFGVSPSNILNKNTALEIRC